MRGRKTVGNFFLAQHGSLPPVFVIVPDQLRSGILLRFTIILNDPLCRFLRLFGPCVKNGCYLLIHSCSPFLVSSTTICFDVSWYYVCEQKKVTERFH